MADAVTVTIPDTFDPAAGEVMEVEGDVESPADDKTSLPVFCGS